MTLSGYRAKLSRAHQLCEELDAYISTYLSDKEHRPSLALRLDPTTREFVLFVHHVPPLDEFFERVGLLVGDIVHNARSALDHLVHDLAFHNSGGNLRQPTKTQFPIADTPSEFQAQAKRYLQEVASQHRSIIESFQPYHLMDANVGVGEYFHPLAMLRDLSNLDKHRLLVPILIPTTGVSLEGPASMSIVSGMVLQMVAQTFAGKLPVAKPMSPGLELVRSPLLPPGLTESPQPAGTSLPIVAFSDGRSVTAVLDKLIRAVEAVVSALEPPAPRELQ
jgi:hypothetical protein